MIGYQYKLFEGDTPYVSTLDFHRDRERAPHLEQPVHRPRLEAAAAAVRLATLTVQDLHEGRDVFREPVRVVDLGCGDGGLLQLLRHVEGISAVGYDFQPSNAAGWAERGVEAYPIDLLEVLFSEVVRGADVIVMTEVLEHLARPHLALRRIRELPAQVVCSSPWTETADSHDACHAWAWDRGGYAFMLNDAGFEVASQETVGMFQVLRGVPR